MTGYTVLPSGTIIEPPLGTGYIVLPDGSMIKENILNIVVDPTVNILLSIFGGDLSNWTALEGASKGVNSISFPQESFGPPSKVELQFPTGQFALNIAHRFTGFLAPSVLAYPHTEVKWFVRNDRTGQVQFHLMTFDGHNTKGGQTEIGQLKPFGIIFYSTSLLDQFTVGFENLANGQLGCTFNVSDQGVFIIV